MSEKKSTHQVEESLHKVWLAGLGALAAAEEEGSKLFGRLVEKGEEYEGRGRERFQEARGKVEEATEKALDRAEAAWEKVEEKADEAVTSALGRAGVPHRDEIATLTRRVEELTDLVEQLKADKKPGAEKSSSEKAAPRKSTAKKASSEKASSEKASSPVH